MTRRRLLALVGLVSLALLAGCFGPTEIPEDQLGESANYTWESDAAASYTLERSSYSAVYNLTNHTTLAVHTRDALGVESSIGIRSLQFRFRNGTVVNSTHPDLNATRSQDRTTIALPVRDGQVAYTASRNGKQFAIPVAVTGPQEITLPAGTRVGLPLLSQVSPGNYTTSVTDNRMTIRWANRTEGTLNVQYYLQRDPLLFGGVLLVGLVVGLGGSVYYLRQIRQLEAKREEIGLDVDQEDDDLRDDGPPPGMG
jgi:hypothetical protein